MLVYNLSKNPVTYRGKEIPPSGGSLEYPGLVFIPDRDQRLASQGILAFGELPTAYARQKASEKAEEQRIAAEEEKKAEEGRKKVEEQKPVLAEHRASEVQDRKKEEGDQPAEEPRGVTAETEDKVDVKEDVVFGHSKKKK